jgi:hypothetical protein
LAAKPSLANRCMRTSNWTSVQNQILASSTQFKGSSRRSLHIAQICLYTAFILMSASLRGSFFYEQRFKRVPVIVGGGRQTSFLKKRSQRLTAYDIAHQNFKYALKVRCGTPHLVLSVI